MKIAFISKYGDAADIAFRMGLDSNDVSIYIDDPKYKENFDGIIKKSQTWQEAVRGKDLLVFDDNKLSHIWDKCHKSIPCFGGSSFAAKLEDERAFSHKLMNMAGIERIESKTYKTLKEVIFHLKEHKAPHVIKPEGKMVESHHVIIGEDDENSDAISQVERLIEQGLQVEHVEVEERKKGIEVGLSFFFNGYNPVGPIEINFEHKHSHEGEKGYLTSEMGTLMRYLEDDELPLYKETLFKMIPTLRAANYRGQIDLNMIVGEDDNGRFVAPLEFTPRLGKPAIFLSDELHITPWADLFMACATGKECDLRVHYDWCVGVMLCAFGFPFEDQAIKISSGLEIQDLDEHSLQHIHPIQVKLDKRGRFVVGKGNGWLLCSTGKGESIQIAKERAYNCLENIKLPGSFYRTDISDKISPFRLEDLEILPYEEAVR